MPTAADVDHEGQQGILEHLRPFRRLRGLLQVKQSKNFFFFDVVKQSKN